MRARHTTVLGGALLAAAACAADGPFASRTPRTLLGAWSSARESIGAGGSWQRTLTIGADGRVVHRGVTFGLYRGQGPDDVSAETVLYGRIGATDHAFVIHTDSVVTRDRALGPDGRAVERDVPRPTAGDSARYLVHDDELELTYVAYPASAPVMTRERLRRMR